MVSIIDTARITLDKYKVIAKEREMEIFNWLKHCSLDDLSAEFEENGLKIEQVFADVAGNPLNNESDTRAIVVGKKGGGI